MALKAADTSRQVGNQLEHTFAAEGVIISVPEQTDQQAVNVQKDDNVSILPEMLQQADFKPRRMVINLVMDKASLSKTGTAKIDPPVTIQVKVTDQDIANAGSKEKVRLAYWFQGKWIMFGEKHGFQLAGDYVQATLAVWGDPPVAMGP